MAKIYEMKLFTEQLQEMWNFLILLALHRLQKIASHPIHSKFILRDVNQKSNSAEIQFVVSRGEHVAFLKYYFCFKEAIGILPEFVKYKNNPDLIVLSLESFRAFLGSTVFPLLDNEWTEYNDLAISTNPRKLLAVFLCEFCNFYFNDPLKYIFKRLNNRVDDFNNLVPSLSTSSKTEWEDNELVISWDYLYIPFKQKIESTVVLDKNVVLVFNEIDKYKRLTVQYRYIWEIILEYNVFQNHTSFIANYMQIRRTWHYKLKDLELSPELESLIFS